jgi:alkaline phosphatase
MNIPTILPFQSLLAPLCMLLLSLNLAAQQPKNLIIYIGDGYGISAKTATRMALGQGQEGARFSDDPDFHKLNADRMAYQGTLTTHSFNSWITDSAPGSCVYAAGKKGKNHNEAIGFNMEAMQAYETLFEYAKKQGYAIGLVTTTRITHATPADFVAHTWNRNLERDIAAQMISSDQAEYRACYGKSYNPAIHDTLPEPKVRVEVDLLFGGGASRFLPENVPSEHFAIRDATGKPMLDKNGKPLMLKADTSCNEIDLIALAKQRGYTYVNSRSALQALNPSDFVAGTNQKVLGLFSSGHMSYEQDRQLSADHQPMLAEMTQKAIEILTIKGGKNGFLLMVEGGRIDHLEHSNAGGICKASSGAMSVCCNDDISTPDDKLAVKDSVTGIYGSDYLIKEVLAFDYAVGKGLQFAKETKSNTLIFSTSDHECGGTAVVALHESSNNSHPYNRVRTYAHEPKQANVTAGEGVIKATKVTPGAGWFPQYKMYDFQGYKWPKPANDTAGRIVISYGSNPMVNDNGLNATYPGNHTPQDVWVGAQDNMDGKWAKKITGRGQLDNTDLTPIMRDFLNLKKYSCWDPRLEIKSELIAHDQIMEHKITVHNEDPYPAEWVELIAELPGELTRSLGGKADKEFGGHFQYAYLAEFLSVKFDTIKPHGTATARFYYLIPDTTLQCQMTIETTSPNTHPIKSVTATAKYAPQKKREQAKSKIQKTDNKLIISHLAEKPGACVIEFFTATSHRAGSHQATLLKGENTISIPNLASEIKFLVIIGDDAVPEVIRL